MPYGRPRNVGAAHRACTLLAPYRVLLLAARPPTDLTCLATVKASSRPHVPPTTKIAVYQAMTTVMARLLTRPG